MRETTHSDCLANFPAGLYGRTATNPAHGVHFFPALP